MHIYIYNMSFHSEGNAYNYGYKITVTDRSDAVYTVGSARKETSW